MSPIIQCRTTTYSSAFSWTPAEAANCEPMIVFVQRYPGGEVNLHQCRCKSDAEPLRHYATLSFTLTVISKQWLNFKKDKWVNAPLHFPHPFSSPPLPSPAVKRPPKKPARGLRECCKLPQWGPGRIPGHKCILMYFELEKCTCRQHFLVIWNGAF